MNNDSNNNPGGFFVNNKNTAPKGETSETGQNAIPNKVAGSPAVIPGVQSSSGGATPIGDGNLGPKKQNQNANGSPAADNLATGNPDGKDSKDDKSGDKSTDKDANKGSGGKPNVGKNIANKAKNAVGNLGRKGKNALGGLGKTPGDQDSPDDLNKQSDNEVKDSLSKIGNGAKNAARTVKNAIMLLPVPMFVKIIIIAVILLVVVALLLLIIILGAEASNVNYESKYFTSTKVEVNGETPDIQNYMEGIIYANYKDENKNFIQAFTVLYMSNIWYDYNEKEVFLPSDYDWYNYTYEEPPVLPSSCNYIFCNDEAATVAEKELRSDAEADGKNMPIALYNCVTALNENGQSFEIATEYGVEGSGDDVKLTTAAQEELAAIKTEIKTIFAFKETIDEVLNQYIEDAVRPTSEVVELLKEASKTTSDYKETLKLVQEKSNLEIMKCETCNFATSICNGGVGFSCNGSVVSPPQFGYPRPDAQAAEISGNSTQCVGWAKYRYAEIALSLGLNDQAQEAGTSWCDAGMIGVNGCGLSKYPQSTNLADAQPGAIMVFGGKYGYNESLCWVYSDGMHCGHVAVVEAVNGDEMTISDGYASGAAAGRMVTRKIAAFASMGDAVFARYIYPFEMCYSSTKDDEVSTNVGMTNERTEK